MSEERRSKFLFGAVILTLLLCLLTSVLLFLVKLEEEQCLLVRDKPQFDAIKLNSIASENYLALAKFLGYLKYEPGELTSQKDPTKVYMPLHLEAVEYEQLEVAEGEEGKQRLLSLSADCANIRFSFIKLNSTTNSTRSQIESVQAALVELPELETEETTTAGKEEVACYLDNLSNFKFSTKQHYACYEPRSYPCLLIDSMGRRRQIATLILSYIAFEIDGDLEAHKRGQYSKEANYCPKN